MTIQASNFPTVMPALTLDLTRSQYLDPRITFARASIGTFVDSRGILQTAPVNVARFDHNPTTGESLGLLVEEPRTNLAIYSENPTQWTTSACSLGSPTRLNRYGDGNVSSFLADGTASAHRIIRAVSGSVTANALYGFSFLVAKSSNSDTRLIIARLRTAVGGQAVSINVSDDGAASSYSFRSSVPFGASPPAAITSNEMFVSVASDGWTRITLVTAASNANTTLSQWDISFSPSEAGIEVIAGTANTLLFVDQVQIEAGAFPTSYIPTTTAAATRSADVASITGTAFSGWYRQDEGTVFAEALVQEHTVATFPRIFSLDDVANTSFIALVRATSSRRWDCSVFINGIGQAVGLNNGINPSAGAVCRGAVIYRANDFTGATQGVLMNADTSGSVPTVNALGIGMQSNATLQFNGHIRRLTFFPQRLPNSTLQALTSS